MSSAEMPPDMNATVIHLPAHGATVTAAVLRDQLMNAATLGNGIVIDGRAVQSIGQAILQLLVAAHRDAAAGRQPWSILNASPSLTRAAHTCRLGQAIGLDIEKAPAL